MVRQFLLILGFIGFCFCLGRAQIDYADISFRHFDQPLSQNTGYCILEDHVGFLWVGTQNGLNRYDGIEIKEYKSTVRSSKGLPSNTIYNLYEDKNNTLWVVTKKGLARYNRDLDEFIPFRHDLLNPSAFPSGDLGASIFEDQHNRIWILADQLACYDKNTNQFKQYQLPIDTSLNDWQRKNGLFIFQDSRQQFWYSCYNSLYLFNPNSGVFSPILNRTHLDALDHRNLRMRVMVEDQDGILWMAGLEAGLIQLDYRDKNPKIKQFPQALGFEGHKINNVFVDQDNAIWFSSENEGVFVLLPDRKTYFFYQHNPSSTGSISSISIQSFYQDKTGRMWLGNYSTGLDYVDPYTKKFNHYTHRRNDNSLSYNNISCFEGAKDGKVWIGTDGGGLNLFDPATKTFKVYRSSSNNTKSISSDAILDMAYDEKGRLWLAHWEGGISIMEGDQIMRLTTDNSGLSSNNISAILHDGPSNHLLGTQGNGLIIYNAKNEHWKYFNSKTHPTFSLDLISDIFQDQQGNIWIGGIGGLIKLTYDQQQHEQFESFVFDEQPESLSDQTVEVIFQSSDKRLWIGTKNGLNLLNADGKTFTHFNHHHGLPDNTIEGIVEDQEGQLWLSTHNGLSRIQLDTNPSISVRNYRLTDGIQGKQFNRKAAFKAQSGELYFGGVNGFNQINIATLNDNPHVPSVVLTDFKIFNQPIQPSSEGPLLKHIASTDTIILNHQQSVFSFDFTALNFTHPENNQYAYMLEGFDDNWYYIGNNHSATFTNIPHGAYTFKIKASNNDGIWNDVGKSVTLLIKPPWWKTTLAYFLYSCLAIGLLALTRKIILMRFEYQQREKLLEKEREIDQLKLKFFMNISHEFKTPLTLILAPLENLITINKAPNIQSQLTLIQRNAKRLQRLINQLLDLRTIDAGKYELKLQESDIIEFLKHIFEAFDYLAQRYQIQYQFESSHRLIKCNFDKDILDKVIYNILSNAFKYTPNGGQINMSIEQKGAFLQIQISDTGVGIAPNKANRIFERFYRIEGGPIRKEGGTGIGLALSKELIQLHQGDITLTSKVNKGTTFTVTVPILDSAYEVKDFQSFVSSDPSLPPLPIKNGSTTIPTRWK